MAATSLMDATSAIPRVLIAQQLGVTETAHFTTAAANFVKVSSATMTNTSGSPVVVSLSVVPVSDTAGNSNRILYNLSIAGGDTTRITEMVDVCLRPGDVISAIASAATSVNLVVTGVIFS